MEGFVKRKTRGTLPVGLPSAYTIIMYKKPGAFCNGRPVPGSVGCHVIALPELGERLLFEA